MKSKYIYPETHVVETLICSPCMLDPVSGGEPVTPLPGHPGVPTGAPLRRIGGLGSLGKVGSVK